MLYNVITKKLMLRKAVVNFTHSDLLQWIVKTRYFDRYGIFKYHQVKSWYSIIYQHPNCLAAQWAVWFTVGNTLLNRWLTSPQSILGILGHGIGLIQYHQLKALPGGQQGRTKRRQFNWIKTFISEPNAANEFGKLSILLEDSPGAGETQNGTSNNTNTSVIWCI